MTAKCYNIQQTNNLLAFFDKNFETRRKAFFRLKELFQKENVRWSLACSSNLFFRGIVDDFHDFDIIVQLTDIPKVMEIMNTSGAELLETGGNGYCESDKYLHYFFYRCDVDIIAGFRVNTFGMTFQYNYSESQTELINLDYMQFPLVPVEVQYILYGMMEGWQQHRKFKRRIIEEYLHNTGILFPEIFRNAICNFSLPEWLVSKINNLLRE